MRCECALGMGKQSLWIGLSGRDLTLVCASNCARCGVELARAHVCALIVSLLLCRRIVLMFVSAEELLLQYMLRRFLTSSPNRWWL